MNGCHDRNPNDVTYPDFRRDIPETADGGQVLRDFYPARDRCGRDGSYGAAS
jgi:hypothetical protein